MATPVPNVEALANPEALALFGDLPILRGLTSRPNGRDPSDG